AEARKAEAQARLVERRAVLHRELATLNQQRAELRSALRKTLGYVTALEQYAPKRALALYQALDATLAAPLAIEAVSAQTLATLVQDETVWTGLADQIDALDDDASALEQAIGALTSTLGPSGQLAGAISEVDDFQRSHPLSRYRERWQSLA